MLLARRLRQQGSLLFRWRSFIPLIFLPLLVVSQMQPERLEVMVGETVSDGFEILCLIIVALGLAIRAYTVGFVPRGMSGRNTRGQVATVLNTTGMFSITHNPLYLGNAVTYLGICPVHPGRGARIAVRAVPGALRCIPHPVQVGRQPI